MTQATKVAHRTVKVLDLDVFYRESPGLEFAGGYALVSRKSAECAINRNAVRILLFPHFECNFAKIAASKL